MVAFVARSRNPWRSVSYPKIIFEVSCLRKEMSKKICEVEWRSPAPRRLALSGPRAPRQHTTQPSYPHMRMVLTFAVRLGPRAPCFAQARPCFAHAGAASPQAARRNSPTPRAQLHSRTECDDFHPGERERERQSQTIDARSRPPADCAFCACTLCADCAAIAIVGRGDHGSLMEPATRSRLRFGNGIPAAEQAVPRPSTPQPSDGSALSRGSANALGPRQIVARGAQAPSWLPSRRYGRVTARAGGIC